MSIGGAEARVAVLVDCDNTRPAILEHALRIAAQFGRVVVRRGYGNHGTLTKNWQESLVNLAFSPCLQYQYAAGKNTSDIALALDALEAMFDGRADTFCLVTSDSDFAYVCRKLRERGAVVYIVGEAKSPGALRNACDQFFEWVPEENAAAVVAGTPPEASPSKPEAAVKAEALNPEPQRPAIKRRPKFIVDAVSLLVAGTSEGKVQLGELGQYLKRTDPAFTPNTYGHSGLLNMIKTYDLLATSEEAGGWFVSMVQAENLAPQR
ncbi:NYN domain-containing protein [Pseudomonas sp. EA_105y_Pfl2_R69]|uniref:NYN domain-containing protein n=1 Tax=Pseudomonas sp. EA_105y_Pfl2_R69 TaxID=3088683 RepID=UPI0030DC4A9A